MTGGANVSIGMQLIETFVIVIVFSISMQFLESSFGELRRYQQMAVDVYPLTYNSAQIFLQDPSSCFPILEQSIDERNGAEYSFSSFILVSPDNFTGQKGVFRHVYHKGSPEIYPLMAPGVFFRADTNTLRVYQNSTLHWNTHVDVPNIPLNKWFHLVVMLKGNALDVYINGNLANRHKFKEVPKLNYSNFYLLSGSTVNTSESGTCSTSVEKDVDMLGNETGETSIHVQNSVKDTTTYKDQVSITHTHKLRVIGAMRGYVSRVKYYAFALNYTQIDKLLREGPAKVIYKKAKDPVMDNPQFSLSWTTQPTKAQPDLPFYQTDDWWTSKQHSGLGPQ